MSFTLVVTAPDRVTKAQSAREARELEQLEDARWVEITPSDYKSHSVAVLSFHHDVPLEAVRRFFAALVAWARGRGYGVQDMQAGQPIDLDAAPDISARFLPEPYAAAPCLMSAPGGWEIVVGERGVVGSLRAAANGDIRLIFGEDEASAVPIAWLLEKVAEIRRG